MPPLPLVAHRPRVRRLLSEGALAGGIALVLLLVVADHPELSPAATVAVVLLALAQVAPLHRREAHPQLVAALSLAAALGMIALLPWNCMPFGAYVAVGALAARRPPRRTWWTLAALVALAQPAWAIARPVDVAFLTTVAVCVWGGGELLRTRRARRREEATAAIAREQARIARELHDVIAHSVAVIAVQAAAGGEVFDSRPERARDALSQIETTARETLGELRRLLGALDSAQPAPLEPHPTLARLDELIARVRATGLAVHVRERGAPTRALPAAVDLSAYRIVQEALTNTIRHAAATEAQVTLAWIDGALDVEVSDDGRGCPHGTDGGRGTAGMRERVLLLGGSFDAGPLPGGGYRVHARLEATA